MAVSKRIGLNRQSDSHAPKGLKARLRAYEEGALSEHLRTERTSGARSWAVYAAVGGSALAMASSASANIIYSGPIDITAGPVLTNPANVSFSGHALNYAVIPGAGKLFFGVSQSVRSSNGTGAAFLVGPGFPFEIASLARGHATAKRFASGAVISQGGNFWPGNRVNLDQTLSAHDPTGDFAAGQTDFAAFRIYAGTALDSNAYDYGWLRLKYSDGPDGLPNEVQLIDWAYNTVPGASIMAGQTSDGPSAPEPSTAAMALLAAGAAGVLAWGRAARQRF